MKKAVVGILNQVPVVCIVIGEVLVVYTATAIAKLAFAQLDPLYSVWYRVGFMAVMLLLWRRPWQRSKRGHLFHRSARSWALVVLLGCSLVLMNTMFYVAVSNMDMGIAVAIEFLGPLSVAVITGKSWRERLGIGIAAVGVVLLAGISLANPSGQGNFLIGLIAILIGGSMWGVYIVTDRRVASGGNSLDNLVHRGCRRLAGAVVVPWRAGCEPCDSSEIRCHMGACSWWAMETVDVAVCDFPDGVLHPVCGGTDYVAPHHLGSVLGHAVNQPRDGRGCGTGVWRDSRHR